MPEELETKLSGANNIKQVRAGCAGCEACLELTSCLNDSMQIVQALMESLFV